MRLPKEEQSTAGAVTLRSESLIQVIRSPVQVTRGLRWVHSSSETCWGLYAPPHGAEAHFFQLPVKVCDAAAVHRSDSGETIAPMIRQHLNLPGAGNTPASPTRLSFGWEAEKSPNLILAAQHKRGKRPWTSKHRGQSSTASELQDSRQTRTGS